GDFAIVASRPKVVSIRRLDQLRGHAEAIPGFAYATFQNMLHVQRLGDGADILLPSAERQRGSARRNPKTRHLDQSVQDILRQAVAEVFVLFVPAEIGEWQYRDRRLFFDG